MKKTLLVTLTGLLLGSASLHAQEGCGTGRYNSEVFTDYTLTSDVVYGNNASGAGALKVDIYQPTGDNIAMRPLLILAHGGSFVGGSKTDDNAVIETCKSFAKMGYVTASIQYTLGFDVLPPNPESAARTVYTTAREMKTAIRFFRKDAATTNTYRINPNLVFIGGNSAGAIIALHAAYLDQFSELPAGIDTVAMGGLEGNNYGNPGYSSKVQGVVNMAGAIGDTTWMTNNTDIPVVSAHGDQDGTVPFGSAMIVFLGAFPVMEVDGSQSIQIKADAEDMDSDLLVFPGDDHCPWNSNAAKMTQVIIHNRDFLYPIICTNISGSTPVADFTANQTNISTGGQVTFTQTSTNAPYGSTWTITPSTGVSYVSGTSATSANPVAKFNNSGTYTVSLNAVNGAGSDTETKTNYITVTGGNVSISEETGTLGLQVFPNPASDLLIVAFEKSHFQISYKMIDMAGKTVLSGNQTTQNGVIQIHTESLRSGVYTLQLQNDQMSKTVRTVIQK